MSLKVATLAFALIPFSLGPILAHQNPVAVAKIPFEIKGERTGETIEEFAARHPKAKCREDSSEIRLCSQVTGVSLADLTTMGDTCDSPATSYWHDVCGMVGVYASFSRGKLSLLSYRFWVNGAVSDFQISTWTMCDAFAKKYGKPEQGDGRHNCSWSVKNEEGEIKQWLHVHTENRKIGQQDAVFTLVILANDASSKDI